MDDLERSAGSAQTAGQTRIPAVYRQWRRQPLLWILDEDGRTPIPLGDDEVLRQARWMQTHERHAALTYLGDGLYRISTVFLSCNHQFGEGPPLLWETMISYDPGAHRDDDLHEGHVWWDYQRRYSTYDQALRGHKESVEYAQLIIASGRTDDCDIPRLPLTKEDLDELRRSLEQAHPGVVE